jgi:hypothetical protein
MFVMRSLCRILSSGMERRVVCYKFTDVSEESVASIFKVDTSPDNLVEHIIFRGTGFSNSIKCCKFLDFWATIRFSRSLLHGVSQLSALILDKISSPYCAFNLRKISAGFSFTGNLTIQRCSTLEVTRPHTTLYYFQCAEAAA